MKKIIAISILFALASCATPEEQARFQKRQEMLLMQEQAQVDAANVQRFWTLPTCENYWSPNWAKVFFDEKQGYCILRPQPKTEENPKNPVSLKKTNKKQK